MTATIVIHAREATITAGLWSSDPPELARGLTTIGQCYSVTGADPDPDRAIAAYVARALGATLLPPTEQRESLPSGTVAG
jgi:hypothetical protein